MRALLILALCIFAPIKGQKIEKMSFTLHFGSAYNFPTPLKIHQTGYDDIELTANYNTEGFKVPVYWDYKLELETATKFFGIRSTHHKLVLTNAHPDIEGFEISHGYNLAHLYYGWKRKHFDWFAGGGVAFSHPEGKVRGKTIALEDGISLYGGKYQFTAPNIELGIRKKIYLYKRLYFNSEVRFIAGYAKPKIIDGYIETWPVSLHYNFGLGVDIVSK
ncbi:hypothetical protein OAA06_02060 [bacterium]|nr:hypothetical protein [bacterium]